MGGKQDQITLLVNSFFPPIPTCKESPVSILEKENSCEASSYQVRTWTHLGLYCWLRLGLTGIFHLGTFYWKGPVFESGPFLFLMQSTCHWPVTTCTLQGLPLQVPESDGVIQHDGLIVSAAHSSAFYTAHSLGITGFEGLNNKHAKCI